MRNAPGPKAKPHQPNEPVLTDELTDPPWRHSHLPGGFCDREHIAYCHLHGSSLPVQLGFFKIDDWITARLAAGIARIGVARQRGAILSLWREAARLGLADSVPQNIRTVRLRLAPPRAWLPDEFAAVLAAIDGTPGAFACGVPRRLLLRAFCLVGFYSGLRPSDLLAIRTSDVAADGKLVVVVQKTGQIHDCRLPPDAMRALEATRYRSRALAFPISRKTLGGAWRTLRAKAGLTGTPKWLRRTGATRCEQQQPGSAMAYLGHRTPGLEYRHYVDLRQLESQRPVPPGLE